jgi:hypothetical protein
VIVASNSNAVPVKARAGDSLRFSLNFPDYPASDGWTLEIVLLCASRRYTFDGEADSDGFSVNVAPTDTKLWVAGKYSLIARVTNSDETIAATVYEGRIEILPDITAVADPRTHEEKVLDAINAVIEGRADVDEYTIGGRSIKKMPIGDLLKFQAVYATRVKAQRIARGEKLPKRDVAIQFTRPN